MTAAATIPHPKTGTIILDFSVKPELWCRSLGHRPKVQLRTFGSCLLQAGAFAHKNTSLYKGLSNPVPPIPADKIESKQEGKPI
jgi:hypothetical protein